MDSVKISSLELENVKRVKAVQLTPTPIGLTVIGGNNNQGKTSVLDAICWALGGDRYRPSTPTRDGSLVPPRIRLELSNGLVVERSGKNSSLKVTDPSGQRAGQQLLNSFVEELALDLPKFMESSAKDKADTLLKIIGVGEKLQALEFKEKSLYNQRHAIGQIADQKKKYAKEMPFYTDVPSTLVSVMELIQRHEHILAVNGENQRKRSKVSEISAQVESFSRTVADLSEKLENAKMALANVQADLQIAQLDALDLRDESTAQIEEDLQNIEQINIKVRANSDREKAELEAEDYARQYDGLSSDLDDIRQEKYDLLKGVQLPLDGLFIEDGELTYRGKKWDAMSGSDQLRVSTAIVRALNPKCGFVLLDKLEQMDLQTLDEFGAWLSEQGLQAIATRVSTGGECSVIIEDGLVQQEQAAAWKAGTF